MTMPLAPSYMYSDCLFTIFVSCSLKNLLQQKFLWEQRNVIITSLQTILSIIFSFGNVWIYLEEKKKQFKKIIKWKGRLHAYQERGGLHFCGWKY